MSSPNDFFILGDLSEETKNELLRDEEIKTNFRNLRDHVLKLSDKIQKEEHLQEYFDEISTEKERQCNSERTQIQNLKNRLMAASLEDASYCQNSKQKPLIFQVGHLAGNTSFVTKNRLLAKLTLLKLEYQKNITKLSNYRKNAFCLEENDDDLEYLINPQNDAKPDEWTISKLLSQRLEEDLFQSPNSTLHYDSIRHVNHIIDSIPQNQEELEQFQFQNISFSSNPLKLEQQNQAKISSLLSDYFSFYNKQHKLLDDKKRELIDILDEIQKLDDSKNEFTEKISQSLKQHLDELKDQRFVLCSEILINAQNQIITSQNVLDSLSRFINSNDENQKQIIANDAQIKQLLLQISNDAKQIIERTKRMSLSQTIEPIQFEKPQKFTLDEISLSQLQKCKKNIEELEKVFDISEKYQDMSLQELKSMLEMIQALSERQINLPTIPKYEPKLLIDIQRKQRFDELKKQIILKQKEELETVKEMIESLPDSIKDIPIINNDKEDVSFEISQEKQNNSQDFTLTNENLSNPFKEANEIIFDRISQKNLEISEEQMEIPNQTVYSADDESMKIIDSLSKMLQSEPLEKEEIFQEKQEVESKLMEIISEKTSKSERKIAMHEAKEQRTKEIEELRKQIEISRKQKETSELRLIKAQKVLAKKQKQFEKFNDDKAQKENAIQELRKELEEKKSENLAEELEHIKQEREAFNQQIDQEIQEIREKIKSYN